VYDKAYQKEAKQEIVTFLAEKGFPQEMSTKKLSELNQGEFTRIFAFVARHFDGGCKADIETTPEGVDYMLKVLKRWKCPRVPTKSTLKAIGTPSSISTAIGVLHWLVETARFADHFITLPRAQVRFILDTCIAVLQSRNRRIAVNALSCKTWVQCTALRQHVTCLCSLSCMFDPKQEYPVRDASSTTARSNWQVFMVYPSIGEQVPMPENLLDWQNQ
jgi:SMC interacting uncharacterized protein involved in chromosome segregation